MKQSHTPLIIGNWKMNPGTLTAALTLFTDTQKAVARLSHVDVVAAPPVVYLSAIARLHKGKKLAIGAQDVYFEKLGAYTGEVGMSMLKSVGVSYVIVGHSEMRARGESDVDVARKVGVVLKEGAVAVLCVGESSRDANGQYLGVVESQIKSALKDIPKSKLGNLVIAYEPVWAIGTGTTPSAHDIHEMKLFIQKIVSDLFGRSTLARVRVLYGGSVTKHNAVSFFEEGEVDGFLVGGASLRASEFTDIVKIAHTYGA